MKIAVTGASGFIGRHVLERLVKQGVETIAITRRSDKLAGWRSKVRIVEMDMTDPAVDYFERAGRPSVLIHLAWDGLPNYKSPHHLDIELPRQYRFLKEMVQGGLSALMVTGTCFEYGMQTGALSENLPTLPSNAYGCAKDNLRRQLESLREIYPFAFTWGRLFYTYGEGQSASSLYQQLKNAVSRGDRAFNMSGGEQLRDYLPIDEVARLIVLLAMHGCNAGVVNICSGMPVSVRELVQGWLLDNGWDIELNLGHYPYPDYEPMAFWGDRTLLDSILDNLNGS